MNEDKKIIRKEEEEKERKRRKAFWLWFLIGLVLVTAISAFGFITFSSSTTLSSSSATSNSSSTSTTPSSNSATPYSISYSYRTIQVQRFQHLSGGVVHSFGMTTSGELYAWGSNELGQLGDGTTANKSIPTLISFEGLQSGETIRDVFAGQYHTFVVTSNGRVYAWGFNNYGQLGDGTLVDNSTPTLISFPVGETIRNVVADQDHSLAVTTTGRVYSWGRNNFGQLGDNTLADNSTPTLISFPGGETIRNVAAGIGHSLAVTTTGQVYAWGSNLYGQLGDGTTANKSTPTLISFNGLNNLNDGETMRDVVAGGEYSHAVTTNGRVYSWGSNNRGQLGDGTSGTSQNQNIANKSTPTLISFDGPNGLNDGETIKNVDIGALHSVAVTTTGRAFGWGANSFNQLGDGTTVNKSSPTLISFTGLEGGETIRNVYLGNGHSLVVTTNNRLYAWGLNNSGQLGDGTSTNKQIPTLIILNGLSATIVNDYLTVNFGETITLPNPTLEGYVFAGWFMDEALTIPYNLTTMPANDVMLYASFIPAN
jgi:uncharacterized repeat protein (TIGR02543 family)